MIIDLEIYGWGGRILTRLRNNLIQRAFIEAKISMSRLA